MRPEVRERNKRYNRQQMNQCPVHGTRLVTQYLDRNDNGDNIDILITKCREDGCLEGHSMTEGYKRGKRRNWNKKAKKIVDKEIQKIENEAETTTQS